MSAKKDFIVFSDDWGRHPFSCQHIVQQLLPESRVLWVNTIGMRRPRVNMADLRRSVQKLRSFVGPKGGIKLPDNLTILSPPMLPFGNRAVRAFNRRSVVRSVRAKAKELGFSAPVLLTTLPNASEYVGLLGESLAVYYCVDEFSEWPGVNQRLVKEMERELLKRVDLVVAVSDALRRSKQPSNRSEVRLLTHGVDVEHFQRAARKTANRRALQTMSGIPAPIIGYFGLFDERSDQAVLQRMLADHPEWSVVVIGNATVPVDRLSRYSNYYHLGAVGYEELPEFTSFFSVCILPYVRNILSDNINPLKLKEYLATGKPVVATALPEAVKLAPWVRIAESSEDFVEEIRKALVAPSDLTQEIRDFLQQEAWETKAKLLAEWINVELEKKKNL